ncbi:MAG: DUF3047 domain-containing protein [Desulfobacterales bacterium]|nr:DUF3047 domain-containing protein [Desulfobacterales bacterium]
MEKIKRLQCIYKAITITMVILFLTYASAVAGDKNVIVIDKFSGQTDENGVPLGWELEEKEGKADIRSEHVRDNFYLHFVSRGSSFGVKKKVEFRIQDFPILNWKWKAGKLPKGGDVREKSSDDQAAQVYIAFPKFPAKVNTQIIGYIWDNEAPRGSIVTSKYWSKLKYIVLRNKTDKLNQWFKERRNVYEDYKMLFGEEPPEVGGISLYINSQHTKSSAESYFDDVYFTKR